MAAGTASLVATGAPIEVAQSSGLRTAFMVGAILSVVAVVGAFFVRRPADMTSTAHADAGRIRRRGLTPRATNAA